jgi:hypothetical protein
MTEEQMERLSYELIERLVLPNVRNKSLTWIQRLLKGCDGTLKWTKRFLQAEGLDVDREVAALEKLGAYCDCEFWLNPYRALQERKATQRAARRAASRVPRRRLGTSRPPSRTRRLQSVDGD